MDRIECWVFEYIIIWFGKKLSCLINVWSVGKCDYCLIENNKIKRWCSLGEWGSKLLINIKVINLKVSFGDMIIGNKYVGKFIYCYLNN